jgi:predicted transcriptional regulator
MTRVAELMSSPVITCPGDATLGEVAALLLEHRIHGVVVPDEAGDAAGVISDSDLMAGEWLATDEESLMTMRALTARELMTSPLVTIDAEADAADAAARLRSERLARLFVTQPAGVVGVVATSDLVRLLVRPVAARATVADVMTRGIVICRGDTTAAQAARAMTDRHSRAVIVVAAQGRPLGVVTGSDLLPHIAAGTADAPVTELMHEPLTIGSGATLREAADRMLEHGIHRLVVVDPAAPDEIPLGTIATTDVLAEMAAPGSVWLS